MGGRKIDRQDHDREGCDGGSHSVHQLCEGTGGVPAAPLLVERRQVVLEGADAPRSGSGPRAARTALCSGCSRTLRGGGGGGRVGQGPVAQGPGAGVTVAQISLPLGYARNGGKTSG